MRPFPQHSPPTSPADSGYASLGSPPSSFPRSSHILKQTKRPHRDYHISRPADFLPPADYQVPKPRDTPRRSGSHIPRPANAFLLFRSFLLNYKLRAEQLHNKQQTTSVIAADIWRSLPAYVRDEWGLRAKEAANLHHTLFPGYKFEPSRKASVKSSAAELATEKSKSYAKKQMKSIFGITDTSNNDDSDGQSFSGPCRPHPASTHHSAESESDMSSCASTPSPFTSSGSASFPSTLHMVALQRSFQQLSSQLELLRSENMQLKQRLTCFEASFAAGQTTRTPQQPLAGSSKTADSMVSILVCHSLICFY